MKEESKVERNGYFTTKYDNGMLEEKGLFENGFKSGYWKKYDSLGKIIELSLYKKDTIVFSTKDTEDYLFAYIDIPQLGFKYAVPKNWKKVGCDAEFCLVKEQESSSFNTNINVVKYDVVATPDEYLENKLKVLKNQSISFKLVDKYSNPYFKLGDNIFYELNIENEKGIFTQLTFSFTGSSYIMELNLLCKYDERLIYRDLFKEMIARIKYDSQ